MAAALAVIIGAIGALPQRGRQQVTPDERLGRVNAAMQILSRGVLPIGALAGGIIAGITGLRGAMAIAVAGIWLSNVCLLSLPREGHRG